MRAEPAHYRQGRRSQNRSPHKRGDVCWSGAMETAMPVRLVRAGMRFGNRRGHWHEAGPPAPIVLTGTTVRPPARGGEIPTWTWRAYLTAARPLARGEEYPDGPLARVLAPPRARGRPALGAPGLLFRHTLPRARGRPLRQCEIPRLGRYSVVRGGLRPRRACTPPTLVCALCAGGGCLITRATRATPIPPLPRGCRVRCGRRHGSEG